MVISCRETRRFDLGFQKIYFIYPCSPENQRRGSYGYELIPAIEADMLSLFDSISATAISVVVVGDWTPLLELQLL